MSFVVKTKEKACFWTGLVTNKAPGAVRSSHDFSHPINFPLQSSIHPVFFHPVFFFQSSVSVQCFCIVFCIRPFFFFHCCVFGFYSI